jgi:hypothetical protein
MEAIEVLQGEYNTQADNFSKTVSKHIAKMPDLMNPLSPIKDVN